MLPPLGRTVQLSSDDSTRFRRFTCVAFVAVVQQSSLRIVARTCSRAAAATAPAVSAITSGRHERIFATNTARSTRGTGYTDIDVIRRRPLQITGERVRQEAAIAEKMISRRVS